jgi:hypothetical protein
LISSFKHIFGSKVFAKHTEVVVTLKVKIKNVSQANERVEMKNGWFCSLLKQRFSSKNLKNALGVALTHDLHNT